MSKHLTYEEMFEKTLHGKVRRVELKFSWFPLFFGVAIAIIAWPLMEGLRWPSPKRDDLMMLVALGYGVGGMILSSILDLFGERKARRELKAFVAANREAVDAVCAKDSGMVDNLERHGAWSSI